MSDGETLGALRAKIAEIRSGPWDSEPDSHLWEHEGISCAMRRNDSFTWCGYAQVPKGHPWHGVKMGALFQVIVHGGLTYADFETIEGREQWWIGFDCNHSGDLSPAAALWRHARSVQTLAEVYRDFAFTKRQTECLADQVAAVGRHPSCTLELLETLVESYFEVEAGRSISLLEYLTHTIAGAIGEPAAG